MPSDLTPEQRTEWLDVLEEGIMDRMDYEVPASELAKGALDALLAAGWTPPAQPDAISAAKARGRREGIEEAAAWAEETACGGYLDGPSGERVASGLRALSSIPPQEAPK